MDRKAARVGDYHACPMVGPPPHVGGPINPPGEGSVLANGVPSAKMGDFATCVGPVDAIATGAAMVLIIPKDIQIK